MAYPRPVALVRGAAPERLSQVRRASALVQTGVDGDVLVSIPGVGRFLVHHGDEVQADAPGLDDDTVAWVVSQIAAPHVAAQRGLLALRGAAVRLGDQAALVLAQPGHGASTIAALLQRRGHEILADGWCSIAADGLVGGPVVLELWEDACRAVGEDPFDHPPVHRATRKRRVSLGADPTVERWAVDAIVGLRRHDRGGSPVISRPQGTDRFRSLAAFCEPVGELGSTAFQRLTELARTATIVEIAWSPPSAPDEVADLTAAALGRT